MLTLPRHHLSHVQRAVLTHLRDHGPMHTRNIGAQFCATPYTQMQLRYAHLILTPLRRAGLVISSPRQRPLDKVHAISNAGRAALYAAEEFDHLSDTTRDIIPSLSNDDAAVETLMSPSQHPGKRGRKTQKRRR